RGLTLGVPDHLLVGLLDLGIFFLLIIGSLRRLREGKCRQRDHHGGNSELSHGCRSLSDGYPTGIIRATATGENCQRRAKSPRRRGALPGGSSIQPLLRNTWMSRSRIFFRSVLRLTPSRSAARIWLPRVAASVTESRGCSISRRIR